MDGPCIPELGSNRFLPLEAIRILKSPGGFGPLVNVYGPTVGQFDPLALKSCHDLMSVTPFRWMNSLTTTKSPFIRGLPRDYAPARYAVFMTVTHAPTGIPYLDDHPLRVNVSRIVANAAAAVLLDALGHMFGTIHLREQLDALCDPAGVVGFANAVVEPPQNHLAIRNDRRALAQT